jgi:NADH:ubiquinone oxidoreductase subunit 6 (subunit J)
LIQIKAAGELDVVKNEGIFIDSTPSIGASLISNFLVPFEILGLILVTTLIGSLMIIRNKKIGR